MRLWAWGALALGIGLAAVACAEGSEDAATATKSKAALQPEAGDDDTGDDDTGDDDDVVVTPKADSGPGDASVSDAGKDSGPVTPTNQCDSPNSCGSADDLGSMAADSNSSKTETGNTSKWFQVLMTEAFGDAPLSMRVSLEMPAGEEYELNIYESTSTTSATQCSTPTSPTTKTVQTLVTGASWPDVGFSPDDTLFAIEVKHISGSCDPAKKWKLKIEGNKAP